MAFFSIWNSEGTWICITNEMHGPIWVIKTLSSHINDCCWVWWDTPTYVNTYTILEDMFYLDQGKIHIALHIAFDITNAFHIAHYMNDKHVLVQLQSNIAPWFFAIPHFPFFWLMKSNIGRIVRSPSPPWQIISKGCTVSHIALLGCCALDLRRPILRVKQPATKPKTSSKQNLPQTWDNLQRISESWIQSNTFCFRFKKKENRNTPGF